MSYAMPAAPRQRPGVVTAAGYLLFGVAALVLVSIIVSASTYSKEVTQLKVLYADDPNLHNLLSAAKIGLVGGILVDVIAVALLVMLGIFNLRGSNGMRITTWVLAGLGVLCCGIGSVGTTLTSQLNTNTDSTETTKVNINEIVPSWARDVSRTVDILNALALILVIIFLAMPAANAFFRKQQAMPGYPGTGWVQPTNDPAYPPIPGYTPGTWAPPSATQQSGPPSYQPPADQPPSHQPPSYPPPTYQPPADQPPSGPPATPPSSAPPADEPPSGSNWPPQGPVS